MFRVVECMQCGWLRQNPRPTEETIEYYYPPDYINFIGAVEDEPRRWRQWDRRYEFLKRRRAIERLKPQGRLLDVGCATGLFLHEMQQAGWEVAGVEPNSGAAAYAQQRFGLQVHVGTLRQAALPNGSVDVLTLWDVLEHVHAPWADLFEAQRLLTEGGLLVLSLPNLESLERRWFGPLWLGWDLPRHLYFFPRPSIVAALSELGLRVEGFRCIAGSYHAWLLSLRFYFEEHYAPGARGPQWVLGAMRSFPARLAFATPFWAIGQAHRASVITVFARKQATGEMPA
jgi:SAM-dependent methyltransferase